MKRDAVAEIKSRIDIVDVVGDYVSLTPAGSNYKAKSPFRSERTPSFMVSPDLQIFKDFGGDKAGDVFTFVMEMEGVGFREALEMLADRAGIKLSDYQDASSSYRSDSNPAKTNKPVLYKVLAHSAKVYASILQSEQSQDARTYLESRHISSDMFTKFQIGYAPNSFQTITGYFRKKNVPDQVLLESGLGVKHQVKNSVYDRFRGRIMLPIRDVMGRAIGYSARILPSLDDGQTGKYINSPQGPLYDKSTVLFGLDLAKTAIKQEKRVIIVEGNLDVVMSHQAGIENVVAVSGTALTDKQLKLLKRFTDKIVLCFDADEAGFAASIRSAEQAFKMGFEVEMIEITGGKDVADLVCEDAKLWQDLTQKATGFFPYYIHRIRTHSKSFGPKEKQEVVTKVAPLLAGVSQPIEKDSYVRQLADLLGISPDVVYRSLPQDRQSPSDKVQQTSIPSQKSPEVSLQEKIIGFAFFIPKKHAIINMEKYVFTHEPAVRVLQALQQFLTEEELFEREAFKQKHSEDESFLQYVNELYLTAGSQIEELRMEPETIEQVFSQLLNELKKLQIQKILANIRLQIQESKSRHDTERTNELLKKYNQLIKIRQSIN